jgi:hypothetical protein
LKKPVLGWNELYQVDSSGAGLHAAQLLRHLQSPPAPDITPLDLPKQNGPGIAPGAVSFLAQRIKAQAVTPFAFSTYSSIWLKFRYL